MREETKDKKENMKENKRKIRFKKKIKIINI